MLRMCASLVRSPSEGLWVHARALSLAYALRPFVGGALNSITDMVVTNVPHSYWTFVIGKPSIIPATSAANVFQFNTTSCFQTHIEREILTQKWQIPQGFGKLAKGFPPIMCDFRTGVLRGASQLIGREGVAARLC